MLRIKVDWPDVETAFERNAPGLESYINKETGEVVVLIEGAPEDAEISKMVEEFPEKYVEIEPASSREQYRWMELFVASVQEQELQDRLMISIDGKGAFRRFKDVLLSYPVERERWFRYRADLLHCHINEWFVAKGLDPDPVAPWGEVAPPPEPEEPISRPTVSGEGPADVLRKQVKGLVDVLPAGELHSARVFLEYLRDRGSAELSGVRGKIDLRRPFRRRTETTQYSRDEVFGGDDLSEDDLSEDDLSEDDLSENDLSEETSNNGQIADDERTENPRLPVS